MSERSTSDSVVAMYGLIAGGARLVLPPMVDLPVVRALRTAMVERMARAHGVTLTVGARRILVDIEENGTIRGNFSQGVRLMLHRLLPGTRFVDAAGNLYRTYGTGVLLRRYLAVHRTTKDPVLSEIEAERVRAGLRAALTLLDAEQAKAVADAALTPIHTVSDAKGLSAVERWAEAGIATVAELPAAWLEAADKVFVETLKKYQ